MRCGRCGNENAEGNRFCGMCGAILSAPAHSPSPAKPPATPANFSVGEPRPQSGPQRGPVVPPPLREQRPPAASAPVQSTAERAARTSPAATNPASSVSIRTPARSSYDEPSGAGISGPSFLGLNQPTPSTSGSGQGRGNSYDDDLDSSSGVDYLLQDEEEPKSGWGKFVLILLALALAAGFGYLRWKQGGFNWLLAGNKKPETMQAGDSAQNSVDNNAPAQPANPPADNTAAGGASAAPSGTAAPASSDAAPSNSGAQPAAATPSAPAVPPPAAAQSAPQNSSSTPASSSGADSSGASGSAPNTAQTNSSGSQKQAQPDSDNSNSASDNDSADDEHRKPPAAIHRAAPKPSPSRPLDSVAEAQRYIYGRGVSRDCDRGVRMLKSAAGQSNAQAMISLGSLYSTGTCAPRDLPTAYRWFAVALHKQPDNQALQNDLQSLWGRMTQPERQLAIKLSQ